MVQDLQDLLKMLDLADGLRIPDSPLSSICIRKVHPISCQSCEILLILSKKANPSPLHAVTR
jgi:hypothetical protein